MQTSLKHVQLLSLAFLEGKTKHVFNRCFLSNDGPGVGIERGEHEQHNFCFHAGFSMRPPLVYRSERCMAKQIQGMTENTLHAETCPGLQDKGSLSGNGDEIDL